MTQIVSTKQAPLHWTIVRLSGLACLLAALIFLPYTLLQLFWGGLAVSMGGGIGSPGGGLDTFFESAPWPALLVGACFMFLMAGKLLRDRHLAARWRATLLLLLILLLLSACIFWQTPFVPIPYISDYYLSANALLLMSIYPCFFAGLASASLYEKPDQDRIQRKTGWRFIPLSISVALVGSIFCWIGITSGLSSDARYWQGYPPPPYSPFVAALYTFPTLLGTSLLGGFLGMCLYRWFQRAFVRPPESTVVVEMAARSSSSAKQIPSPAATARANWPAIGWEILWRSVLAGLVSLIITGILLHISINIGIDDLFQQPFFERLRIGYEFSYHPGSWLIPPFLESSLSMIPFLAALFPLTFLPYLMPLPGVLSERSLWEKHAILPGLGIVLIFLGMAVGAIDLLQGLLRSLLSLWPVGAGSAFIYCTTAICSTAILALLAALALGHTQQLFGKRRKRLLWLLIGIFSFAGSLLPLLTWLQQFTYYADNTTPFHFLSLDTPIIGAVLASSLLFNLLAALFGGWLRERLTYLALGKSA